MQVNINKKLETKKKRRERIKNRNYESSNQQACLMSTMMALINKEYEIIIGKSQRMSIKTIPMVKIVSIRNENFSFE